MKAMTYPHSDMLPVILSALRRHWLALAVAVTLHFGDIISTHLGLRMGLPEGNLIPATILGLRGEAAMYGLKLATVSAVILLIALLDGRYPRLWRTIHVTNAMMVAVLLSNSAQVMAAMR